MDFKVVITQAAHDDLKEIATYISRDSPRAARRLVTDLVRRTEALAKMPRLGKAMSARPGVRRLLRSPYLIIYRINETVHTVSVLRF